jgi:CRP-like cAMP-binding protein
VPSLAAAVRVLNRFTPLGPPEVTVLRSLAGAVRRFEPGETIHEPGQPVKAGAVATGWAARSRQLPDGRRQVFEFVLPGDTFGLSAVGRGLDAEALIAVARVEVVWLDDLVDRLGEPSLAGLAAAIDEAAAEAWRRVVHHMVRLGQLRAEERLADWLLETWARLERAGQTSGDRFTLPATQAHLADALGLSMVHLNRTLQNLKRTGVIQVNGRAVRLLNMGALAALSGGARSLSDPRPAGSALVGAEAEQLG